MYLKILLLSICFAGTICPSFAQQKDVIDILHADTYAVNMKSNIDSLLGNVRLKHKNMLMFYLCFVQKIKKYQDVSQERS